MAGYVYFRAKMVPGVEWGHVYIAPTYADLPTDSSVRAQDVGITHDGYIYHYDINTTGWTLKFDPADTIGEVTGLTAALAGKSDTGHPHVESDITNLTTDLAGKSPTVHTHDVQDSVGYPGSVYVGGESGEEGEQGPPGLIGPVGATGPTGPAGLVGPSGLVGIPGEDGEDGDVGYPGPMGLAGPAGNPGTPGLSGQSGVPGWDGEDGEDGPMGPPGVIGPTGAPGSPGAAGLAGVGIPGEDGEDGETAPVPYQHPISDHQGFPGGTSMFLRADKTFAAPTAAAGDLDKPETGALTVATAKYHITGVRHSATGAQRITVAGTGRWRIQN